MRHADDLDAVLLLSWPRIHIKCYRFQYNILYRKVRLAVLPFTVTAKICNDYYMDIYWGTWNIMLIMIESYIPVKIKFRHWKRQQHIYTVQNRQTSVAPDIKHILSMLEKLRGLNLTFAALLLGLNLLCLASVLCSLLDEIEATKKGTKTYNKANNSFQSNSPA